MKKKVMYLATKITVAVVLVVILAVKAFAGDSPELKLVPHSTDRAIIVINNDENVPSKLMIEDVDGNIVYYEEGKINEKLYAKLFDFKNLEDGTYKVTASNKFGKKEVTFSVNNNKVEVVKDNYANANSPFIEVKDDVLKLSFLNPSLNEIYLTIADNSGEIYRKSLGNDFSITTGFSLAKLKYGDYAATISDGNNTYSYNFER